MHAEKTNHTIWRMARLLGVSGAPRILADLRGEGDTYPAEAVNWIWDTGSLYAVWVCHITYLRIDLVKDALKMAITLRGDRPDRVVFHADRGTQHASEQITRFAASNGITRSMGRTGVCWDNAMAESFFATLKTEFYYRRVWPTQVGAKLAVGAWIEDRYNRRRRHCSIGQISPVAFEVPHCNYSAAAPHAA